MITVNPNEETTTGKCYSLSVNSGQKSYKWIIDLGETQHVCHGITMFMNKRRVSHYIITLPNKMTLPMNLIGDIRIDHLFVLKNVLYVPSFDLNLIYVSALIKDKRLITQFTCHHALIQDMKQMKMIGKLMYFKSYMCLMTTKLSRLQGVILFH